MCAEARKYTVNAHRFGHHDQVVVVLKKRIGEKSPDSQLSTVKMVVVLVAIVST